VPNIPLPADAWQLDPDGAVLLGGGVPVAVFGCERRQAGDVLGARGFARAAHQSPHCLEEPSQARGRDDQVHRRRVACVAARVWHTACDVDVVTRAQVSPAEALAVLDQRLLGAGKHEERFRAS